VSAYEVYLLAGNEVAFLEVYPPAGHIQRIDGCVEMREKEIL
jgi:hypothetical protein